MYYSKKGIFVNSPCSIVDILNTYYVSVAAEIGQSDMMHPGEIMDEINRIHGVNPSVKYIRTNLRKDESFTF